MLVSVFVFVESLLLALVVTPAVIRMAYRINALDRPGVRTVHSRPVARIGGVAIFVSAMITIVSALSLNTQLGDAFEAVRLPLGMLLAMATMIFLIGLVDDLRGLPARVKFLAETAGAVVLCLAGVRISSIAITDQLVVHLGNWGTVLTILWIVGVTNAVNLSDGLDGLAGGVSAIACAVIAAFALQSQNLIMAVLMLSLLGGLCGFLFYNFNPAKVFMGDCGSLFVGFTIASSSMMCLTKSSVLVGLALPMLALGIPIFDTLFSILRRYLERRSLFAPDRSHFHHRLIDLGLKQQHAVLAIHGATCAATGLGLFMMVRRDLGALILFGVILLLLILLFRVVGAVHFGQTLLRLQQKYARSAQEKQIRRTFEDLQLRFRQARDADQRWQAVCDAGARFEFDSVSVVTRDPDGQSHTRVWRRGTPQADDPRRVTMNLPIGRDGDPRHMECQIAMTAGPSLEWAGHKGALFGRLVDEWDAAVQGRGTRSA
jgi:UDP-GlcNAc:undecaprenyl-phosphate GlcNAc-1-phosphate transferase